VGTMKLNKKTISKAKLEAAADIWKGAFINCAQMMEALYLVLKQELDAGNVKESDGLNELMELVHSSLVSMSLKHEEPEGANNE